MINGWFSSSGIWCYNTLSHPAHGYIIHYEQARHQNFQDVTQKLTGQAGRPVRQAITKIARSEKDHSANDSLIGK